MSESPFKPGTRMADIFQILADGAWHCGKHELPGTQPAKSIQTLRQHGFAVETETRYCAVCSDKTVHRRLASTSPANDSFVRLRIPDMLRRRILAYYKNTDAVTGRELAPALLEVDHRFPQVRWSQDEVLDPYMPNEEIGRRFQLLTRANNLWKSRYCEHCHATGQRGTFSEIWFFAAGGPHWNPAIPADDERGCVGCFWYNPEAWRQALNAALQQLDRADDPPADDGSVTQLTLW